MATLSAFLVYTGFFSGNGVRAGSYHTHLSFVVGAEVVCEMMSENQETFFACRSETSIPAVFKFSRTVVKDKLVQETRLDGKTH